MRQDETGDGEREDRGMLELRLSKRWRKDVCMSVVQAICCGELADMHNQSCKKATDTLRLDTTRRCRSVGGQATQWSSFLVVGIALRLHA